MTTVEAKNIVQNFGPTKVLNDISCSFSGTSINVLMGPSGCGKSTLLRMFGGVRPDLNCPTSGHILIDDIHCHGPHDDVVTVFQRYANRPDQTVYENIAFPFRLKLWKKKYSEKQKSEKIEQIIKSVGLSSKKTLLPSQLSGGQNQRVAIARALVLEPKILLMDEPFGALDPHTRMEMQQLVLSIRKQYNCLIVFVTHDIDEAFCIGDNIVVLSSPPAVIVKNFTVNKPVDQALVQAYKKEIWQLLSQKEIT